MGLSAKASEQYQDPLVAAKYPELTLIMYTALLKWSKPFFHSLATQLSNHNLCI
jgi:hypothetical protein